MTDNFRGQLTTPEAVTTGILAGNATITLKSVETEARYTYKITKAKEERADGTRPYFVKLLVGPDNSSDFEYIGVLEPGKGVRTTAASQVRQDSKPVKALSWVVQNLDKNYLSPKVEVWHEGICMRCGRKLTVPESIELGLGPECAGKV